MAIKDGMFYFVKNDFIKKYKNYNLMHNKNNGIKRPFYLVFNDKHNNEIYWAIPLSRQYSKYKKIYKKLIEKSNGKFEPFNFVFINNKENSVFLLQNMFPIIKKYVLNNNYYLNNDNLITPNKRNEIIKKAKRIMSETNKGKIVTFTNLPMFINEIEYEIFDDKRVEYDLFEISENKVKYIDSFRTSEEEKNGVLELYTLAFFI